MVSIGVILRFLILKEENLLKFFGVYIRIQEFYYVHIVLYPYDL
jgi:hypothetical protein